MFECPPFICLNFIWGNYLFCGNFDVFWEKYQKVFVLQIFFLNKNFDFKPFRAYFLQKRLISVCQRSSF